MASQKYLLNAAESPRPTIAMGVSFSDRWGMLSMCSSHDVPDLLMSEPVFQVGVQQINASDSSSSFVKSILSRSFNSDPGNNILSLSAMSSVWPVADA